MRVSGGSATAAAQGDLPTPLGARATAAAEAKAHNLLEVWPALWSFASHENVQPTNNHAERSLRGAVIYRKLSLSSQSEEGEQNIERLLSASITCRLQHRSLFAYLSELLAAHARLNAYRFWGVSRYA